MPDPALYINGKPQNLPAAAYDALEWLRAFGANPRLNTGRMKDEDFRRFQACREALEAQLAPHLPAEYVTAEGDWERLEDELRQIFNPEGHVSVELPSGAVARVAPDCSPETLAALERAAGAGCRAGGDGPGRRSDRGGLWRSRVIFPRPRHVCRQCESAAVRAQQKAGSKWRRPRNHPPSTAPEAGWSVIIDCAPPVTGIVEQVDHHRQVAYVVGSWGRLPFAWAELRRASP